MGQYTERQSFSLLARSGHKALTIMHNMSWLSFSQGTTHYFIFSAKIICTTAYMFFSSSLHKSAKRPKNCRTAKFL